MRMTDGRKRLRRGVTVRDTGEADKSHPIKQKLKASLQNNDARPRGTETLSTGFIWIYHCNTRKQTREPALCLNKLTVSLNSAR